MQNESHTQAVQAPVQDDYSDYFATTEESTAASSEGQEQRMSYDILREQHRMRDRMPLAPKTNYNQTPSQPPPPPMNVQPDQSYHTFEQPPPPFVTDRGPQRPSKNKYGDEGFE